MDAVLLSIRCLLAAVFLVAAVGKLLDLTGSRRALEGFGVPTAAVPIGGVALPLVELAVGIALLVRPTARWGALCALLMMLAFAGAVDRAMSRGEAPDCHCFGQIHSEPAGPTTLIRNGVLAAMAVVVVVAGPGPSVVTAVTGLHGAAIGLVAVSVLAAVFAVAVVQLWADRRRLRAELRIAIAGQATPGLSRGTPAPDFDLAPVRGGVRSLTELTERLRPSVLVFVSTTCGPCVQMLPTLGRWQGSLSSSVTLAAIFTGEREEVERLSAEHELSLVLAQEDNEAFDLYELQATPTGVLIDVRGIVASAPAEGVPAIEALIRTAAAQERPVELAVEHG